MSFTPDLPSTEDVLSAILSSSTPPLPPAAQTLGSVIASWQEVSPGRAWIETTGGTSDDRHYAEQILAIQLAAHGYERPQFDMDEGEWDVEHLDSGRRTSADPFHKLWFRPGPRAMRNQAWGRGFVRPNGEVWTWPEAEAEHMERALSINDPEAASPERSFTIDPMGGFTFHEGPVSGADPMSEYVAKETGLTPGNEGWYQRQQEQWKERQGALRTAAWPDIMAKAKRLIQSGQVQLLRNGYQYVVGHVIGDHGAYNAEFSRDDPNSRAITQWQCECSPAGTPIVMADGSIKAIERVKTGDLVLTATGHAGVVGRTMNREYDGRMIGLKIEGSTDVVWLTENHKLVTADVEAKEAGKWRTGDYSYLPQPQYAEQTSIRVADFVEGLVEHEGKLYRPNKGFGSTRQRKGTWTTNPRATTQKPIPAEIALDARFARLAGLFVAEGIATPRGELRWSFNAETEQHLADEVIELLRRYGLDNAKKKVAKSAVTVAVQSKPMSQLFIALFGTGSRTKRLAMPIMAMSEGPLRVFFDAWVEGDGHSNKLRTYLGTASDTLAMQARLILARLGRESVIRRIDSNASPLVPRGGSFNQIAWRTRGGQGQRVRWFENEQVTQRMQVQEQPFTGTVYNFEVLGEHSYVLAPGIASLNCPWDQYAFDRTRKWKKYEGRPCSHLLALYWKSLMTPFDEQLSEEQAQNMGTGQRLPGTGPNPVPGQKTEGPAPDSFEHTLPRSMLPDGSVNPGDQQQMNLGPDAIGGPPGPAQAPMSPPPQGPPPGQGPQPPGVLPPFPGEQQEMQWAGPGTTPSGMESPPGAMSVPGAKPPTPFNPLQQPGTYSKTADFQPPQTVRLKDSVMGLAEGPVPGQYGDGEYREVPAGTSGEVLSVDQSTGWLECIFPLDDSGYHEPFHVRCFLEPSEVQAASGSPFIRRRSDAS